MTLNLSLEVRRTDDNSIEFVVTMHNNSDKDVTFSTPSSRVFSLSSKDEDGDPVHIGGVLATQAFEQWTVEAGETLERTIEWVSQEAWMQLHEEQGREFDADEMWEHVPENYDEITVTITTCTNDDPVADLSLTERVTLS